MDRTNSRAALRRKDSSSGKGGENFKVAVRTRPLIDREMKGSTNLVGGRVCWLFICVC